MPWVTPCSNCTDLSHSGPLVLWEAGVSDHLCPYVWPSLVPSSTSSSGGMTWSRHAALGPRWVAPVSSGKYFVWRPRGPCTITRAAMPWRTASTCGLTTARRSSCRSWMPGTTALGLEQQDPGGHRHPDEDTQPLALLDKPGGRGNDVRALLRPLHVRPISQGPDESLQGHPGRARRDRWTPSVGERWQEWHWWGWAAGAVGQPQPRHHVQVRALETQKVRAAWGVHTSPRPLISAGRGTAYGSEGLCGSPEEPTSWFVAVRCHLCVADGPRQLDPALVTFCAQSSKEK